MCGGLNAPPRTPTAATSAPDLPVAVDDVLEGRQLSEADGSARMKLLGGIADLGAHPELEAVGEAGRGVHVHHGRVDSVGKRLRGVIGGRDDRLRVPSAV